MSKEIGNIKLYHICEVATIINKSTQTVRRRIANGKIKSEKINNGYLVSHKDLVDYLEDYELLPESIIDLRLNNKPISNVSSKNQKQQVE